MKALTIAVQGDTALTRRILQACWDEGHQLAGVRSSRSDVLELAAALGVPTSESTPACDLIVRADGADDVRALASVLQCWRELDGEPAGVRWGLANPDGSGADWHDALVRVDGYGADRLAEADELALHRFLSLLSRFARSGVPVDAGTLREAPVAQSAGELRLRALRHPRNADTAGEAATSMPDLAARFRVAARRHADRPALRVGSRTLDFASLDRLTDAFAARLQARLGPAPSMVAISLPKSIELYVAILAVLKSGHAYVPIDPEYPDARREYMRQDAGADLVVAEPVAGDARTIAVDLQYLVDAVPAPATPGDRAPAVVIYTSGSTGQPKGAVLSHRNIAHFCDWYTGHCPLAPDSVALQFSTVSFDASLLDMFPAWFAGACVVPPDADTRADLDALAGLMRREGVTHAFLPPALLAEMAADDLPALRHLVTGGDVCDPDTIARWSRGRLLHNVYGPTECTVLATTLPLVAGCSNKTIGFPIAGTRCLVLDAHGDACPTGQEGELFLCGAGVGLGYHGREELTQQRFVPSLLAPGRLMYRTGDLVHWNADGSLEFVGRVDTQVKMRGFRVELGEIENALLADGAFRRAAVVVDAGKRIIGYVSGAVASPVDLDTLQRRLASRLPDYMLPARIIELPSLPATPNGKIDRQSLARLEVDFGGAGGRPAGTDLECRLQAIWARVLGLDAHEFGIDDSFFDLGGHSLLVSRMLLGVRREIARATSLGRFMENPTIASLASLLTDPAQARGARVSASARADAEWPADFDVRLAPALRAPADEVLLTGANGFLGCFLLDQLLHCTPARVVCLVRADDDAQATSRLNDALVRFGLLGLIGHRRVQVLAGHVDRPGFGLSPAVHARLADSVGAIYHNAANVNHVLDYTKLRDVNVLGTLALLRFAFTGRPKSFDFISTLSAASALSPKGKVVEEWPADHAPAFVNNGYNVSKWVAERLVAQAAQRGLDARIHRPGNITGDSLTGNCDPSRNRILLMLKGSVQLGMAPEWDMQFDLCPVDYVARAVVALSRGAPAGRVFHLHNPSPLTWLGYLEGLRTAGYAMDLVDPARWRARLSTLDESNAMFDVVGFYLDDHNEDIGDMDQIESHATVAALAALDIVPPPKDADLLAAHFGHLRESGFFPPVTARPRAHDRSVA